VRKAVPLVQATEAYAVLGVASDATQAEISSAFRRLVRQHHPDLRSAPAGDDLAAVTCLDRVLSAYEVLREQDRRADQHRRRSVSSPEADETVTQPRWRRPAYRQPPIQAGPVVWRPVP
jgi:molecular chaperone DnaJ